jgi:hypothetical protein
VSKTLIIVIVVLCVLLLLYVVGVGVGLSDSDPPTPPTPPAPPEQSGLKSLANLIGGRGPLDLADVERADGQNGQAQPGVYRIEGQSIRLAIAQGMPPIRLVRLTVSGGACVVSVSPRDDHSVRIREKRLSANESLDLSIPREGADILLAREQGTPTVHLTPVEP